MLHPLAKTKSPRRNSFHDQSILGSQTHGILYIRLPYNVINALHAMYELMLLEIIFYEDPLRFEKYKKNSKIKFFFFFKRVAHLFVTKGTYYRYTRTTTRNIFQQ